jgi:hypothetical protein
VVAEDGEGDICSERIERVISDAPTEHLGPQPAQFCGVSSTIGGDDHGAVGPDHPGQLLDSDRRIGKVVQHVVGDHPVE